VWSCDLEESVVEELLEDPAVRLCCGALPVHVKDPMDTTTPAIRESILIKQLLWLTSGALVVNKRHLQEPAQRLSFFNIKAVEAIAETLEVYCGCVGAKHSVQKEKMFD